MEAYLEALYNDRKKKEVEVEEKIDEETMKKMRAERKAEMDAEKTVLLEEAAFLTRSLYRRCLRGVNILRPGNEHDEAEFLEREKKQKEEEEEMFSSSSMSFSMSMALPVDRENELSSRANYYTNWARENIEQESDCFDNYPWRWEELERYVFFYKRGEEQRRWILRDYKFEDPHSETFDEDRVDRFAERVSEHIAKLNDDGGRPRSKKVEPIEYEVDMEDPFHNEALIYYEAPEPQKVEYIMGSGGMPKRVQKPSYMKDDDDDDAK